MTRCSRPRRTLLSLTLLGSLLLAALLAVPAPARAERASAATLGAAAQAPAVAPAAAIATTPTTAPTPAAARGPVTTPESAMALPSSDDDAADADDAATTDDGGAAHYDGPDGIRPGPRPGGRPLELYRNRMVDSLIHFFTERKRDVLERGWRRSGRYLPMIRRVFREEGVPEQLAYLAAVESNFNPHARSPARAVGMWQFTAPTARKFGLQLYRPWYDERIDPVASTHAAARLLAYLYDRYNNWELALAAYNAGEARVNQALQWARRHHRSTDYWSLRLPRQTRGFVPALLAIAAIMEAPQAHGLADLPRDQPLDSEPVEIRSAVTLGDLASRLNIPVQELVERNPAWRGGLLPPLKDVGPVQLWVPPGTGARLLASLDRQPPKTIPWLVHKVREGDTVSQIAHRYRVRVRDVLALNHLGAHTLLAIGQPLLVPVAADTPLARVASRAPRFVPETSPVPAVTQLRLHRVQSGESLWSIAREYGVRMTDLRTWNRLPGSVLQPDQELLVYLPEDWTAAR
ncbi:MAG TPA: transglycosylase SLT domain-containing protein [bacterium]|nr:transglycosylase SLT domain-containing protein [bacterium]